MPPVTRAAILCGGRGERLRPLSDYFQKVMIPIGPKKLPALAYIIKLMTYHGIDKVALLTGYRSEDIKHYFGSGAQFGVDVTYSEDEKDLKGSLNAVANALKNGAIPKCDELLIYYGDIVADLDLTALMSTHRKSKADATLVLSKGYSLPVGIAEVKAGMVESFKEKPLLDMSVATGCVLVGPRSMSLISRVAGPKKTDLMTHFVPELLGSGGKVAAFYTDKEWHDIGTIAGFEKLNAELGRRPLKYMS